MNKPLTLTERAIVKLNHITLTLHYTEFQKRMDRLVGRLTGERVETVEVGATKAEADCSYCELETPCAEDCGSCH